MRAVAHFYIKHLSHNGCMYQVDADHGGAWMILQSFYWDAELLYQCVLWDHIGIHNQN